MHRPAAPVSIADLQPPRVVAATVATVVPSRRPVEPGALVGSRHCFTPLAVGAAALLAAAAPKARGLGRARPRASRLRASRLRLRAASPLSDGTVAACDSASSEEDAVAELRLRLSPGPLLPETTAGRALRRILQIAPDHFQVFQDYELLRARLGGEKVGPDEEAEAMVLFAYWQLQQHGRCPPRPAASAANDYSEHVQVFGPATWEALKRSSGKDFQLLAQANVKILLQDVDLPWVARRRARALYEGAMHFGHALRHTELRFMVDGAAGTFVPLSMEAQMAREELEEAWARAPSGDGEVEPAPARPAAPASDSAEPQQQVDAESAQQSLQQVLKRLHRMGQSRPGLATYLSWLGKFDPEAWGLMLQPSQLLGLAMSKQLDAIWGCEAEGDEEEEGGDAPVALTPSDLIEAVLFGAWLCDAEFAAEDMFLKHRQLGYEDKDGSA